MLPSSGLHEPPELRNGAQQGEEFPKVAESINHKHLVTVDGGSCSADPCKL